MARRGKRRQRPQEDASQPERVDAEVLAAAAESAEKRAQIAAERGNPYAWRRYTGPPDPYWLTASLFRPMLLIGQLHPLDELVNIVTGERVCYLIDLWPHRWPDLVAAGEAARGELA